VPASLALKHRPTRLNGRLPGPSAQTIDLVGHARTAGTTIRLTVPEMTLRVTTVIRCSGACEAPPANRRDGPDGRCRAKPSPLLG
jgi:hypothetical protein